MPEEKLNRSQVAGLLVDLGRLRPPHRMRTIGGAVKPGAFDPGMDDPCILPCREVRLRPEATWEEILSIPRVDLGKPGSDRGSGLFGDFELNRPARLFLNDGGAVWHPAASANIVDLQPHEVTASELAIDGEIEQSKVARPALQLKPDPDRPNVLGFERTLLPGQTAFVPGSILHDRLRRADHTLRSTRRLAAGHSIRTTDLST